MFFSKYQILNWIVIVSILIIVFLLYHNTTTTNIIASVLGSIVASIAVSNVYNNDLHEAMNKYSKIGLINYFDNFEDAHDEIKMKISLAKNVDIFVMYGDSFLNTSSKAIRKLLSKENTNLRYFMYSENNRFIESYGFYWSDGGKIQKYNADGIREKIINVKTDLKNNIIKGMNEKSSFQLYSIKDAPISFSFYKIDDELYYVPNKNIRAKEIIPVVFHFKKTNKENSMYNRIEKELNLMVNNNELIRVDL